MNIGQIAQICAASVSSACSAFLLFCFWAFSSWREDPFGTKHVLFVLTLFNFVESLNYAAFHPISPDKPEVTSQVICTLQSGLMQAFEVSGSWLWTAIFSFEVARFGTKSLSEALINRLGRSRSAIYRPSIFSPGDVMKRRTLCVYHMFSFLWIVVPTILLFSLGLNGRAGNWCFTSSKDWLMFSYICLWLEFFVIIVASIVVARLVLQSRAKQYTQDAQVHLMDIVIAQRLMLVPLMYILLHLPGTIVRLRYCFGLTPSDGSGGAIEFLQGICDPSQGTVNLISMLIIDRNLRTELQEYLCSYCCKPRSADEDRQENSVISMTSSM